MAARGARRCSWTPARDGSGGCEGEARGRRRVREGESDSHLTDLRAQLKRAAEGRLDDLEEVVLRAQEAEGGAGELSAAQVLDLIPHRLRLPPGWSNGVESAALEAIRSSTRAGHEAARRKCPPGAAKLRLRGYASGSPGKGSDSGLTLPGQTHSGQAGGAFDHAGAQSLARRGRSSGRRRRCGRAACAP